MGRYERMLSTFSIAAYDPKNGDLGVAVQSKYFSVGPVVPWAEAGVGAIATQAWANPSYGPEGLKLLKEGFSPEEVVDRLTAADGGRERRQLGVVDAMGDSSAYTGPGCIPWAGSRTGLNYSCQGNILAGEDVVRSMAEALEGTEGELADRLVAALEAGQEAGGDIRGMQSAALLVVRKGRGRAGYGDNYVDLRVEDHRAPIRELRRLLDMDRSTENSWECHRLLDDGRLEEAMLLARGAVELSPENDVARMALCRACHEMGYAEEAVEAFRTAHELNGSTLAYVRRIPRWSFILEDEAYLRSL